MPATAQSPAQPLTGMPARRAPSIDDAVLVTLLYSDLFDYPLRTEEVHANLVIPASLDAVRQALERLTPHAVSRLDDDLHCLRGREAIAGRRRLRHDHNRVGWRTARRFGRWLRHVPFVRSVAVCGSLAVDNAGTDGDVDLFVITAPGRLWTVQVITMVLRRLARRRGAPPLCPNYLLTEADLTVGPRSLYLAHEATQTRLLWGASAHRAFRRVNAWTHAFLPQRTATGACATDAPHDAEDPDGEPPDHPIRRGIERALGGRFGGWLEGVVYRSMLTYYRLRLRRHGWDRHDIAKAYRRDRQTVMTGGYHGAVATRFRQRCRAVLGDAFPAERAFVHGFCGDREGTPIDPARDAGTIDEAAGDPHFAEIFERHYGPAS